MFTIGKAYKLHTPLGIWIGLLVEQDLDALKFDSCSWIPDEGRMHENVKIGTYNECEPVGDGVIISRGSIAIAVPWVHTLPSVAK